MKKWTKALSAGLVLTVPLLMPLTATAQTTTYTDVPAASPYGTYISDLTVKSVVRGNGDGTFHPEEALTRAQVCAMIVRAFRFQLSEKPVHFADSRGHWGASFIQTAYEAGIVSGQSDTVFAPDAPVKREEAAAMVWRYLQKHGLSIPTDTPAPADADAWAQGAVVGVLTNGLHGPDAAGTEYRPQDMMLRQEAAALLDTSLHAVKREVSQDVLAAKRPDHVIVVVEENHSAAQVIGNSNAPYVNSLAKQGANFTNAYALDHPSQPNYLELFSGAAQGVTDDGGPYLFPSPNLGSELLGAHFSFAGYSEDLPYAGFTGLWSHQYGRKHAPWVDFTNVPASANLPFTAFPKDYNNLKAVSFVIPNLDNDMHDGTIAQADTWLKTHLDSYVQWAKTHNSLLIVTWDENDDSPGNHIPTLFVGPMVQPGTYSENITHHNVLRTLEDFYWLPYAGKSANVAPIADVWRS